MSIMRLYGTVSWKLTNCSMTMNAGWLSKVASRYRRLSQRRVSPVTGLLFFSSSMYLFSTALPLHSGVKMRTVGTP